MRHIAWKFFMIFCVAGLAASMPSAWAYQNVGNAKNARSSSRQVQDMLRHLSDIKRCQRGCHDCWYGYFPGMVNYCRGLRDWENGSYGSGMELLKLAAGWGNKDAQYTLGLIYFKGEHVPADLARSLAWLMLANERHNAPKTIMVERSVQKLATPGQKRQARQLFRQLRTRYGDKVAGARAWRHLRNRLKTSPLSLSMGRPRNICFMEGGGLVPWAPGILDDPHVLCLSSGPAHEAVARIASNYFDGMTGTVSVGPLQSVIAPASASSLP